MKAVAHSIMRNTGELAYLPMTRDEEVNATCVKIVNGN
jgi:hypothetical protein